MSLGLREDPRLGDPAEIATERNQRGAKYFTYELCKDARENIIMEHARDRPKKDGVSDIRIVTPIFR